ncbi:hypothetical protein [Methylobacterium oryzae]|uniref:Uncharacterized protein n=1 Tax=Methylobacterium oryzae TaxID=334852 RepID=A0ABU7TIE1_9HYPH
MSYRVALYSAQALLIDGRPCRRWPAAAYTGIANDQRYFAIVQPVDIMSASCVPASDVTGNPADGGVIELHAPTERPSDVPLSNFIPWVPPNA